MKHDSCRQCVRRRIQCDAKVPECSKCVKKGIKCSGVGIQYRFVDAVIPRGSQNPARNRYTTSTSSRQHIKTSIPSGTVSVHHLDQDKKEDLTTEVVTNPSPEIQTDEEINRLEQVISPTILSSGENIASFNSGVLAASGPLQLHTLELFNPGMCMLFDHFSLKVAPAMVVIDRGLQNGYRDILLPLATCDSLVQRAVSVTAALHIGKKQPHLLEAAEKGRLAIIKSLKENATNGQHDKIFNISTWATIILLLVAETVTGGQDFAQLFPMLRNFLSNSADLINANPDVGRFLQQQSHMFNLFAPPFLGPEHGTTALQRRLDEYFDWIPSFLPDAEQNKTAVLLKEAIRLARDLYVMQVYETGTLSDREYLVETLVQLLSSMSEDTPGMHAFVWCYFIAGAATTNPVYREFVAERLRVIYQKTEMRNILSTLDILEQLIWHLPGGVNWTRCPAAFQRTLVM